MRIASFDIGRVNFAQYVEEVDVEIVREFKGLTRLEDRELLLDKLFLSGKRVQTGVYAFSSETNRVDINVRRELLSHLRKFRELWDTCDVFIIEQQFFRTRGRGSEANVDAIKLAEATLMWFLDRYPSKIVTYFGSQYKTRVLNAPRRMSKPQRKKWAEETVRKLYSKREDIDMISLFELKDSLFRKRPNDERKASLLNDYPGKSEDSRDLARSVIYTRQKLDDIADACLQAQAFKFKERKLVIRIKDAEDSRNGSGASRDVSDRVDPES